VKVREFLMAVYDACARRLSEDFAHHQWRIRFSYLQLYFDDPNVHYEVWVQRRAGRIELGLHFEGPREQNQRWAAIMGEHALEVQARLGPALELEDWTETWTRLHETRPIDGKLTVEQAERAGERLAQLIDTLQPIVEDAKAGVRG
jgi:hypothetical protein